MPPLSEPITVPGARRRASPSGADTSVWVEDPAVADPDRLVTAARAGRSAAWDEIFARLRSDLLRFVRSRGVADPDDVLQEVMAAAVRQIGEIEGGWSGLRAWVFTVASRRCADFHRLRRSRPEVPSDFVPESHWAGSAADEPLWEESAFREASAALSILTEREREVVTLRVVDELDAVAVASALGVTPVNVRVIQSRALAKLRRYLDNNGGCLDKRFRLFPFPAVAEFRRRLGELFPWRFSGGRSPRRPFISHRPTFASSSPSVVDTGSWSLSSVFQSAAILLLATGVGGSSFGLIPEILPTPVVQSASGAVSGPLSSVPVSSPPDSPTSELLSGPPPQKGLYGQVSTRGINHPYAGVVVAEVAASPTTPASPSEPIDAAVPSPSSTSSRVASAVTNVTGEVASGMDDAVSATAEVVDGVSEAVSGMMDDARDSLDLTEERIGETSEKVEDTTDVVEDVVGEASEAAGNAVDNANDAAEEVTDEIVDLISVPFGG